MALKDFLDYVGKEVEIDLKPDFKGNPRSYKGILVIAEKRSSNPSIGVYRDLEVRGEGYMFPTVCSADVESPFSSASTIRDGRIIRGDKISLKGAA